MDPNQRYKDPDLRERDPEQEIGLQIQKILIRYGGQGSGSARLQPVDLHTGRREERLARAAEHNRKVSRELVFFNRS